MEYAGSGCNYNALPENGGVANETNEVINRNNGKVWLTSTDQSGKFKVGDTFAVDQQTGFVDINAASISINVASDLSPELGGNLDVLTRSIYSSLTSDLTFGNPIKETVLGVVYPVASQTDIGTNPNQIPLNQYLGTLAFQDQVPALQPASTAPTNNLDINFEYVSNTSIKIRMRGSDGTVRAVTLTLT